MRAVAAFAERQGQPLLLYAEEEGRPLLCSIAVPGSFEADFVLATLGATGDSGSAVSQDATSSAAPSAHAIGRGAAISSSSSVLGKRSRSESAADSALLESKRVRRNQTASSNAVALPGGSGNASAVEAADGPADGSSSAFLWTKRAHTADAEAMVLDNGDVPDSDDDD